MLSRWPYPDWGQRLHRRFRSQGEALAHTMRLKMAGTAGRGRLKLDLIVPR